MVILSLLLILITCVQNRRAYMFSQNDFLLGMYEKIQLSWKNLESRSHIIENGALYIKAYCCDEYSANWKQNF